MSMSTEDFTKLSREAHKALHKSGLRGGPAYHPQGSAPGVWHDQVFERDIAPSGAVECSEALLAGQTQNGLDIILVASHANEADLNIAAGASITLELLQAEKQDGDFQPAGPSICVTAPDEGIVVEPDGLACRIAIGNTKLPWIKAKLTFAGSISGGNVDCALSYVAR